MKLKKTVFGLWYLIVVLAFSCAAYAEEAPEATQATSITCTDTDDWNSFNYGACTDSTGSFKDECTDLYGDERVHEYYCNDEGYCEKEYYPKCAEGYMCSNGACLADAPVQTCSALSGMDNCLNNPVCYWDQQTNSCYDYRQKCSEADGGNNIYSQGHTFGFRTYSTAQDPSKDLRIRTGGKDACLSDQKLVENYCADTYTIQTTYVACPDGCVNGACMQQPSLCTDTDNGREIYTKGTVTAGNAKAEDSCSNTISSPIQTSNEGLYVVERYCAVEDGVTKLGTDTIQCPSGTKCRYGACVKPTQPVESGCTDSDGGRNYYERGKAVGLYSYDSQKWVVWGEGDGNKVTVRWDMDLPYSIYYDHCYDSAASNVLNEAYCENGIIQSYGYDCPNGCKDGACIGGAVSDPVKESVKCVFEGGTGEQKCYSSNGNGCTAIQMKCSSTDSKCMGSSMACYADVSGKKGESLTWKSTCGGYAYTMTDGVNDVITFKCNNAVVCPAYASPAPSFCTDGTIISGGVDANGCPQPPKCSSEKKSPYCNAIGTKSEGWYKDSKLINYASCGKCTAVCNGDGTKSEGWYSSCDNTLILYGDCTETTSFCTTQYDPVCGTDGNTYSNECHANNAGVSLAYKGECGTTLGNINIADVWADSKQPKSGEKVIIYAKITDKDGTPATPEEETIIGFNVKGLKKSISVEQTTIQSAVSSEVSPSSKTAIEQPTMVEKYYKAKGIKYNQKTGYYEIEITVPEADKVTVTVTASKGQDYTSKDFSFAVLRGVDVIPAGGQAIDATLIETEIPTGSTGIISDFGESLTTCLNGCAADTRCLPFGTRIAKGDSSYYCGIMQGFEQQKPESEACQNSYECFSNQCSNGHCVDIERQLKETQGMLEKIMSWLSRLFK